ncbi:MAG: S-adenosylmethionine decarboxylase [Planctomycetes bacterium]|nr:S-adenosylmethionine decarboxylase [Planctomycetota bacterium]
MSERLESRELMSGTRVGWHLVADLFEIPVATLANASLVLPVVRAALEEGAFQILRESSHVFDNGAFTAIWLLSESHCSLHSYPELGYLAFDLFSCGSKDPTSVLRRLLAATGGELRNQRLIERGIHEG